jgi:membrane protease YdiL (CAAX protease family)
MRPSTIYSDEPARGWLPWAALAPILCVLFVALPLVAGSLLLLEHFGLADAKGEPIGFDGLCAFLLLFVLDGAVVLAWVRFVERRSLATLGLGGDNRAKKLLQGVAIGIGTILVVVLASWLAGGYHAEGFAKAFHSPMAMLSIAFLLFCFVVQSGVEEILFRGWLLSVLARKLNVASGVAISSVVFAFLHFSPGQYWLVTTNLLLFGLFTCCWALKANTIWGVMGWHAGWNWLSGVGFELPITGLETHQPALLVKLVPQGSALLTGGPQGPEGSLVCTLFFAGASAWLLWRIQENRKREDVG